MGIVPFEVRGDRWEELKPKALDYIIENKLLEPDWDGLDGGDHRRLRWWKFGGVKMRTILDAGCGIGTYYPILKEWGQYTGVDVSPEILARVREKYPEGDFWEASILELPFDSRSFDLVHCMSVMMHLRRFEDGLQELWRVCRKYLHFNIYLGKIDYITHGVFCDTLQFISYERFDRALDGLTRLKTRAMDKLWDTQLDNVEGEHFFVMLRKR